VQQAKEATVEVVDSDEDPKDAPVELIEEESSHLSVKSESDGGESSSSDESQGKVRDITRE